MAKKEKELATQRTLCGDPTFSHEANFQGLRELEQQKVLKTPADDITERLLETQTKVVVEPAEDDRGSVGDSARDSAVDLVGSHRGNLTRDAQLQP